jgi:Zn-dependent protease with chaperone function
VPAEARPPALSLAAPDPGLAGLSGAKALASYRAPARLRRSIAGLRVAQGACFAAAAFLISRSEGWLPFLAAAAVEAALVPRMAEDRRRAGPLEFPRFEPWLSGDCAEILSLLVRRLGLPEDRAPAVAVADDFGARNAAVQGQGIRKESRVTIGSGFAGADLRPVAGVLAHELGHLALGDASSWKPKDSAMALFALSMASLVFIFAGAAAGFLSPRDLVRAVCLEMAAFPLGVAGVVVGAALQRRIELRADHFSGWLTDPRWLIEHFREGGEPVDFRSSPWGADHPDNAARIRSLEREFGLRDR